MRWVDALSEGLDVSVEDCAVALDAHAVCDAVYFEPAIGFCLAGQQQLVDAVENTSAPPPGIDDSPASLKIASDSSGGTFHRRQK